MVSLLLKIMSDIFNILSKNPLKKHEKCFLFRLKGSFCSHNFQFLVILLLLFQLFPFKTELKKWYNYEVMMCLA